jgi:hypothetical protein
MLFDLAAEADGPHDELDGDPDGDGEVEEVVHAEEELDDQRDVLAVKLLLAGRGEAAQHWRQHATVRKMRSSGGAPRTRQTRSRN